MRGPPPKPQYLKDLAGNPGKRKPKLRSLHIEFAPEVESEVRELIQRVGGRVGELRGMGTSRLQMVADVPPAYAVAVIERLGQRGISATFD